MKAIHRKWKRFKYSGDKLYTIEDSIGNMVAAELTAWEADHIVKLHNDWLTTQDIEDEDEND